MKITIELIKSEFKTAEDTLEFCWSALIDITDMIKKSPSIQQEQVTRMILFQDRLATTIFRLQSIRDKILFEEKRIVSLKPKFKPKWFVDRLRTLSKFKDGIDMVVNMAKALGDAYAYFFYQFDLDLLTEHLITHRRVINKTAGMGEHGELAFVKNIKHIDGHFLLYHGITNTLRHGDFSFINLKTFRVSQIGELKTKQTDDRTLTLSLTIVKRPEQSKQKRTSPIKDDVLSKTRKGRQILGIANLLDPHESENNHESKLYNDYYGYDVECLIKETKKGSHKIKQVSEGLAFCCVKGKKNSLYGRVFQNETLNTNLISQEMVNVVKNLVCRESENNGILLGQLLYNSDYSDKNTPGTTPIFWHPIQKEILKQLYFGECFVISIFNPAHLIIEIEKLGYFVDSKYATQKPPMDGPRKLIERFDLFISYINNFLMAETCVTNSIKEAENFPLKYQQNRFSIRMQQHFDLYQFIRNK